MSLNHIKKIALVGASGNVGSATLKALLATNQFDITIVTRPDSKASFPTSSSIEVKKGSYDDAEFLKSAFTGQDAAVFAVGFTAMNEQTKLIEGAAKAGVKWIVPTEYAGDGMNTEMMNSVPMFAPKVAARQQIDELAKTYKGLKWIGIATNPWAEFSIQMGMFGLNPRDRTAILTTDSGSFNTSTLHQIGLGIARLLSLPIQNAENPRASLEHYGNNFAYISSLLTTQKELFEALQRATQTSEADWKVQHTTIAERLARGREGLERGDMMAGADLLYATYMGKGLGGDYSDKAKEDAAVLGLEDENLDDIAKRAVETGSGR